MAYLRINCEKNPCHASFPVNIHTKPLLINRDKCFTFQNKNKNQHTHKYFKLTYTTLINS
jgi:hypothetical protein